MKFPMVKIDFSTKAGVSRETITGLRGIALNLDPSLEFLGIVPQHIQDQYKSRGFFDGPLLCCFNYAIQEDVMRLNCGKSTFFRTMHFQYPRTTSVNAVMWVNGDSTLLIKRPEDVYSFPNYFDFPAGLVPYLEDKSAEEMFIARLNDRIETDTGISGTRPIILSRQPVTIDNENCLSFYYNVSLHLSRKKLKEIQDQRKKQTVIIKKSELSDFIDKEKIIYPEILKQSFLRP